jgi:hypothetical protein
MKTEDLIKKVKYLPHRRKDWHKIKLTETEKEIVDKTLKETELSNFLLDMCRETTVNDCFSFISDFYEIHDLLSFNKLDYNVKIELRTDIALCIFKRNNETTYNGFVYDVDRRHVLFNHENTSFDMLENEFIKQMDDWKECLEFKRITLI